MTSRLALGLLAALALSACAGMDENVRASAETVLTLQSGTISDLKAMRGQGPFETYDVEPGEMVYVLRDAARKARGLGGEPVGAIFVSEARREVVAKERAPEEARDDTYDAPFRTAMVATVHPVVGDPTVSKVEIHAVQRGPFHRGVVAWERDMPAWIRAVVAERASERAGRATGPIKPIP